MIIQLMTMLAAATFGADSIPTDTLRPHSIVVAASSAPERDTVRRRPHAIEVSEWYGRRLTIHRALSYATIPVFAAEYVAGERLFKQSNAAPQWAKFIHRAGATALAGMFTVNTVTGLWNLWDSRMVSNNRALRTSHALMMLTADAAFTYAGAKLADQAEGSLQKRKLHRTIALSAMGLTMANGLMMKLFNK
jgi:hypothetical protein